MPQMKTAKSTKFEVGQRVFVETSLHEISQATIVETDLQDDDGKPQCLVEEDGIRYPMYLWDIGRTYSEMKAKFIQRYCKRSVHSLKQAFFCLLSSQNRPFNRHSDWKKEPIWWNRK